MLIKILHRTQQYLLNFVHTQLFLTLISMPVLIAWGLPISWMTFIGNLIFAPVLMLIIGLSSLLFFTELCAIPNTFIASCFNYSVDTWHTILKYGSNQWLLEQANPGFIWLALMPIIACIGLLHPRSTWIRKTKARELAFMFFILCLGYGLLSITKQRAQADKIFHSALHIEIKKPNTLIITDSGYFNSLHNAENLRFTLKPYLISTYGTSRIQQLKLNKISKRSFNGALTLLDLCDIESITLPYFPKLEKKAWASFFKLKKLCKQKNCVLIRTQPLITNQ